MIKIKLKPSCYRKEISDTVWTVMLQEGKKSALIDNFQKYIKYLK